MSPTTRRSFLKTGLAAGAMATVANHPLSAASRTATDTVVQGALGQQEFTRIVRYAYDRGIRFFETAEAYQTPGMLGEALKGLPRDSYQLMNKVTTFHEGIRTHGASVHGLPALRQMPGTKWLDVGLIRINHNGARMDGPTYEDTNHPDNVSEVVKHIQQLKKEGLGVIGMKLCGGGQFEHSHDDRVKAMRFAFQNAGVDCATVGFKSTQEIDEAISNMNLALA